MPDRATVRTVAFTVGAVLALVLIIVDLGVGILRLKYAEESLAIARQNHSYTYDQTLLMRQINQRLARLEAVPVKPAGWTPAGDAVALGGFRFNNKGGYSFESIFYQGRELTRGEMIWIMTQGMDEGAIPNISDVGYIGGSASTVGIFKLDTEGQLRWLKLDGTLQDLNVTVPLNHEIIVATEVTYPDGEIDRLVERFVFYVDPYYDAISSAAFENQEGDLRLIVDAPQLELLQLEASE